MDGIGSGGWGAIKMGDSGGSGSEVLEWPPDGSVGRKHKPEERQLLVVLEILYYEVHGQLDVWLFV